jgi:hypothetical protein
MTGEQEHRIHQSSNPEAVSPLIDSVTHQANYIFKYAPTMISLTHKSYAGMTNTRLLVDYLVCHWQGKSEAHQSKPKYLQEQDEIPNLTVQGGWVTVPHAQADGKLQLCFWLITKCFLKIHMWKLHTQSYSVKQLSPCLFRCWLVNPGPCAC